MKFVFFPAFIFALAIASLTSGAPPNASFSKRKRTSEYFVDGKHIPGVPFEVSDSYAGLLPISKKKNDPRQLFFWWYPSESDVGKDDLVIWLNGGPGCSSLEGLLQENGPWLLPFNSTKVVKNQYSWTKLANVLWVEQPVSVGLGTGKPDITNELELAKEFYGFLVNFYTVFPELRNKKLYITGESYAGKYIPYIANEIFLKHSKSENQKHGINFQGLSINDPSFINDYFSVQLPAVEFAKQHQHILGLNNTFIAQIEATAKKNGVHNFVEKNLRYPPRGPILLPPQYDVDNYDAFDAVYAAAQEANPCFNVYDIDPKYHCPSIYDPLGYPPDAKDASPTNFVNDQPGFKEYIHADPHHTWLECVDDVFIKGNDGSKAPADTNILKALIEQSPSGRTTIQHGLRDFVLIANGSALGIQNVTWNGQQGFQRAPDRQLIVEGQEKGLVQIERGLTFLLASGTGHMIPQDQPATAFKMLQYLLGQISSNDLYR